MDDIQRHNFWNKELPEYKLKLDIEKTLRSTFIKYLVQHVHIKDDPRCRTEIMLEEMANEVMKRIKDS